MKTNGNAVTAMARTMAVTAHPVPERLVSDRRTPGGGQVPAGGWRGGEAGGRGGWCPVDGGA